MKAPGTEIKEMKRLRDIGTSKPRDGGVGSTQ